MIRSLFCILLLAIAVAANTFPSSVAFNTNVRFQTLSDAVNGPGGDDARYCAPTNAGIPNNYVGDCSLANTAIQNAPNLAAHDLFNIPGIDPANTLGVFWGGVEEPTVSTISGLIFLPVKEIIITEDPILLGVFIHQNIAIVLDEIVNLVNIEFSLETDGNTGVTSVVGFSIDETLNSGVPIDQCPYHNQDPPSTEPCPDKVTGQFPGIYTITTNTGTYQLILTFRSANDISSDILNEIVTEEFALTPGFLFAQIPEITTGERTTAQQTTALQTTVQQTTAQPTTGKKPCNCHRDDDDDDGRRRRRRSDDDDDDSRRRRHNDDDDDGRRRRRSDDDDDSCKKRKKSPQTTVQQTTAIQTTEQLAR